MTQILKRRVSYETRFVSNEPKLELKLVLTLSDETKRLVSVVLRKSGTACFGILVEPKQQLWMQNNCNNIIPPTIPPLVSL
jgi:hypothetical protein